MVINKISFITLCFIMSNCADHLQWAIRNFTETAALFFDNFQHLDLSRSSNIQTLQHHHHYRHHCSHYYLYLPNFSPRHLLHHHCHQNIHHHHLILYHNLSLNQPMRHRLCHLQYHHHQCYTVHLKPPHLRQAIFGPLDGPSSGGLYGT